jgi:protoheme ferro-lyase
MTGVSDWSRKLLNSKMAIMTEEEAKELESEYERAWTDDKLAEISRETITNLVTKPKHTLLKTKHLYVIRCDYTTVMQHCMIVHLKPAQTLKNQKESQKAAVEMILRKFGLCSVLKEPYWYI